MAMLGVHNDVPRSAPVRLPTVNSGVCRCGAVFDNGTIAVPLEYRGLCGRCVHRGIRLGTPVTGPRPLGA